MADDKTPIEAGSIVRLKSGGEWMTVESITDGNAKVVWMDEKKKVNRELFPIILLDNHEDWTPFS